MTIPPLDRRQFLKTTLLTGAGLTLSRPALTARAAGAAPSTTKGDGAPSPRQDSSPPPGIIDTNVNVFQWPFRKLKYADTGALVAKLRQHRVVEAWAGSFEGLLHKDIAGVNERLAAECRERGQGLLVPMGSVNLAWPDWEDDIRRCHETWKMPGVRIHPGYQPFDLSHPGVKRLIQITHERGLLLQIVFQMEDPRVHHPLLKIEPLDARPLVAVLQAVPEAKVELLHFSGNLQGTDLNALMTQTSARVDISRWEGNGAIGRMIGTAPGSTLARVPLDRVLFGSHAPYFPVETAMLKLMESPLDATQLQAIMQGNARKLLSRA